MPNELQLTPSEVAKAAEDGADAEKLQQERPSWSDWKALGAEPQPGADGVMEANVGMDLRTPEGRRAFEAMGEMLQPSFRRETERGERFRERNATVRIKGPGGATRTVVERYAEQAERKFHVPKATMVVSGRRPHWEYVCAHGHYEGFFTGKPPAERSQECWCGSQAELTYVAGDA